ncbi:HAMP domain-containing sensor histidine kinase [Povalibacter sp.]|uniref:sensor histidine kinase n=1 Tax=Povalibacter sp. TaxID=1962978 RepID=UPI002F3E53CA
METISHEPSRIDLLATVAHELRNPLAAIQAAVRVLDTHESASPSRKEARALIDRQVLRIARLSDDLLDAGYLTSGKPELRKELIDLRNLVNVATETCRPQVEAGHFAMVVLVPPEPVMIEADPLRISQVLINLLDNATKFSEPYGMIVIGIEDTPGVVSVRVVDHGIGIPPEVLPRIFDPFVQADSARTRSRCGIGIGLNVVKRIVELHRGTVQAFSAGPELGSTFTVRLPRHA